ncbi:brachyurin-like [Drosophila rhopaloa]|uniref:trypsin n=2 Tax=Drosophila rhopaloa TaxID=1041015 RepID=A0ABM5J475_DRORH|nr:brachyurin-like [Drosophila rhopaloa]
MFEMKVFVVLLLALASVSAGVLPKGTPVHPRDRVRSLSIQNRIINGRDAVDGEVPYQVGMAFFDDSGSGWWCGGSFIDKEHVLTAAHCTIGWVTERGETSSKIENEYLNLDNLENASFVFIYEGSAKLGSATIIVVDGSELTTHESYNPYNLRNDIALVRTPVHHFTELINKIALPKKASNCDAHEGKTAQISGFGLISDSSTSIHETLQIAKAPIIPNIECSNYYGTSVVTERNVCINTEKGSSTCRGDSGGPLVVNGVQVGITSFGSIFGCEVGAPTGFTCVSYFLDWIRKHTKAEHE